MAWIQFMHLGRTRRRNINNYVAQLTCYMNEISFVCKLFHSLNLKNWMLIILNILKYNKPVNWPTGLEDNQHQKGGLIFFTRKRRDRFQKRMQGCMPYYLEKNKIMKCLRQLIHMDWILRMICFMCRMLI